MKDGFLGVAYLFLSITVAVGLGIGSLSTGEGQMSFIRDIPHESRTLALVRHIAAALATMALRNSDTEYYCSFVVID